jgi:predicted SnoaL-like aldol condensation-catalyzing enzyme
MARNTKSPLELHRSVLEGYATMTVEQAREVISDRLVLHEADGLPFGGIYRGPEGFVELMQTIQRDYPSFDFQLDCMLSDGEENIIFQGRMSADTPGGHLTMPVMERWRFENDKAVEIIVCWHDTRRARAMFTGSVP